MIKHKTCIGFWGGLGQDEGPVFFVFCFLFSCRNGQKRQDGSSTRRPLSLRATGGANPTCPPRP
jgi:hypothetical protein